MFAGIGGFREGLTLAGDFVCVGHCEIDKYADRSYRALFDTEGEWFIEDLQLLQNPQYEELWAELLGGFAQGGGELMSPDSTRIPTGALQWPLPVAGTITSQFGHRVDPITGEVSSHTGTDIACAEGTPILAAADGTVTVANGLDSWGGSYGYYIQIDHGGGLETLYAHCSSICVTTGQQVQAGQVIGYVGHTGRVTGNHLHLEIRINGNCSDVMAYFS